MESRKMGRQGDKQRIGQERGKERCFRWGQERELCTHFVQEAKIRPRGAQALIRPWTHLIPVCPRACNPPFRDELLQNSTALLQTSPSSLGLVLYTLLGTAHLPLSSIPLIEGQVLRLGWQTGPLMLLFCSHLPRHLHNRKKEVPERTKCVAWASHRVARWDCLPQVQDDGDGDRKFSSG